MENCALGVRLSLLGNCIAFSWVMGKHVSRRSRDTQWAERRRRVLLV